MPDVSASGVSALSDRLTPERTLDDRLRRAAGRIMDAPAPQPQDVAEAQRVLTLRAAEIRAPFEAKIRRAKEAAG
jgi:hypothetical protein